MSEPKAGCCQTGDTDKMQILACRPYRFAEGEHGWHVGRDDQPDLIPGIDHNLDAAVGKFIRQHANRLGLHIQPLQGIAINHPPDGVR